MDEGERKEMGRGWNDVKERRRKEVGEEEGDWEGKWKGRI